MAGQPSGPDFVGVVVAAGSATRFGGDLPKQFRDLAGRSVLRRSVEALARQPAVDGVVVVLAESEVDSPRGREARAWPGVSDVVGGGATRRESVRRGLAAVAPRIPFVLVHDAARPLAGARLIGDVIAATRLHGAAIPGLAVPDTVKRVDAAGHVLATVGREGLRLAQTPQGARRAWLVEALDALESMGERPEAFVTDEAAALEAAGRKVAIVPGDPANRKITTEDDLDQARRMLGGELRSGTGFDVHRLGAARDLVLGGVRFAGESGLIGHSDADVVLHAAMDALLGAAALGDIGLFFPPSDPRFKDADSTSLSRQVAARLRSQGFEIVNLDLTVLAERPRIGGRRDEMRNAIAECFGIAPERVGVKATTLEGLGALGRGEGIACQASALIRELPR